MGTEFVMNRNLKKTVEEHCVFVEQIAKISFFLTAKFRDKIPDKTAGEILRDHTPLFYHALNYLDYKTKWDNPDCQRIMEKANELKDLPASEFEEAMYLAIKDFAMKRAKKCYPGSVGVSLPEGWNAGSLKYDPPKDNLPEGHCCFHIANALAPRSIYDDPEHLPECFIELMNRSEKEYGYHTLYTGSWLNDTPRWLALFPAEWINNLSPGSNNIGWHFGYWGQLVTARGTFNEKAGQFVRNNLELKYKTRSSHCSFSAMRKHLANLYKGAVK